MSRTIVAIGTYTRTLPHVKGIANGVRFILHDTSSDGAGGSWTAIGNDELEMGDGPSYVAIAPVSAERYLLVACNEGDPDQLPGTLTSRTFELDLDRMSLANVGEKAVCDTGSSGPCHLSISTSRKWVCAATYFGGAAVCAPLLQNSTGDVSVGLNPACLVQHDQFSNADPSRQEKPHAHQAVFSPDGGTLLVCDLGGDCVVLYTFDDAAGTLCKRQTLELAPGCGPRHAAFHPTLPLVYIVCELSSVIAVCRLVAAEDADSPSLWKLELAGTTSTLPGGTSPNTSWCSAIRVSGDGRFVFAANRGHDSVAIFQVEPAPSEPLKLTSFASDFGTIPRDIALHPTLPILYVASQNDNLLSAFSIGDDGVATRFGSSFVTPTPVCVVPFLA